MLSVRFQCPLPVSVLYQVTVFRPAYQFEALLIYKAPVLSHHFHSVCSQHAYTSCQNIPYLSDFIHHYVSTASFVFWANLLLLLQVLNCVPFILQLSLPSLPELQKKGNYPKDRQNEQYHLSTGYCLPPLGYNTWLSIPYSFSQTWNKTFIG